MAMVWVHGSSALISAYLAEPILLPSHPAPLDSDYVHMLYPLYLHRVRLCCHCGLFR